MAHSTKNKGELGVGGGEAGRVRVRRAAATDAERLAALATQLGYTCAPKDVWTHLSPIESHEDHFVAVAELEDGHVIGWVHAYVRRLMVSNPHAEIGGLVVDAGSRGSGVGRLLMQHAEDWARENRLEAVYLRSNVIRQDAHRFYEALGYKIIKTQHAFLKVL
jgi:GNAT superfamily N-acetyltransferase